MSLENILSSVTASTFRIELESGDSIETTGVNLLNIENQPFWEEKAKTDLWPGSRKALKKFARHMRQVMPKQMKQPTF